MTQSPTIIILSEAALPIARRIARATGGEVHGLARRITESVDVTFTDAGQHLGGLFSAQGARSSR
jgi:cobalt-precorrin 5A hydrolase/precorrin-3B C17-methyltransferase